MPDKKQAKNQANAEAEALAKALGQAPPKTEKPIIPEPEKPAEPTEASTFLDLIAQLPNSPFKAKLIELERKNAEEIARLEREKVLLENEKVLLEKSKTQAKAWDSFKEYFTKELYPAQIQPKLKELGLETTNKKLVVTFPDGKVTDRHEGGNGKSRTMPELWGKGIAISEGGGKTFEHSSPKKMAESLNLQVEGRKDMLEVFSDPIRAFTPEEAKKEGFAKVSLPKIYKIVEAIRGKGITIEILPKPI